MSKDKASRNPNIEEMLAEFEKLKKENKHLKKAVANLFIDNSIFTEAIDILKKRASSDDC